MKTIFLHIGYHKTGTTAIQNLFCRNETFFSERGILYPKTCRQENTSDDSGLGSAAHHRLPLSILEGERESPENLLSEIQASSCGRILISSEVFMESIDTSSPHAARRERYLSSIRSLFEGHRVKIIVYLRPQDSLYESVYNQQIKESSINPPLDPENLPDYYDYLRWIRLWARYFGEENILVRPYEAGQFVGGNLYSDFLGLIDGTIDVAELDLPPRSPNTRLSQEALFFKRIVNRLNIDRWYRDLCTEPLLRYGRERAPETQTAFQDHGLLSDRERREIRERYAADNATIARQFLGREDGRLFSDLPRSDTHDEAELAVDITPESALEIAEFLLASLRPDWSDRQRRAELVVSLVKAVVALLPGVTFQDTSEKTEELQRLILWQQWALDAVRLAENRRDDR